MSNLDPEEELLLKDMARRNAEKIKESAFCIQPFEPEMVESPFALIQLALIVLLDKPLFIFVPPGTALPENLRRLARYVEEVDFSNAAGREEAYERLHAVLVREGLIGEREEAP